MSIANHIYGITMQEAGVSSPISVRFEEAQEYAEQGAAVGA
jgi:chromosome segregation ATPase